VRKSGFLHSVRAGSIWENSITDDMNAVTYAAFNAARPRRASQFPPHLKVTIMAPTRMDSVRVCMLWFILSVAPAVVAHAQTNPQAKGQAGLLCKLTIGGQRQDWMISIDLNQSLYTARVNNVVIRQRQAAILDLILGNGLTPQPGQIRLQVNLGVNMFMAIRAPDSQVFLQPLSGSNPTHVGSCTDAAFQGLDAKNDTSSGTPPARPQSAPLAARESVARLAGVNTPSATSQPTGGSFVVPTKPDPLALALLYETYLVYKDTSTVERKATLPAAMAFSKCMIEHRTANVMTPNELWEFLTHSADILRSKNAVASYWPRAQRFRTFTNRKEFEFVVTKRSPDSPTQPVNALVPASFYAMGEPYEWMMNQVNDMGFSDPDVCVAPPTRERSREPADEPIVLPD
jgi:hypothetical protein